MSAGQAEEPARGAARQAVVEELRALGLLALDRLDPLLDRLNEAVSTAPDPAVSTAPDPAVPTAPGPAVTQDHRCTSCPVCVAFADVRAGHPDALGQVARHAAGLMTALRAVLAQDGTDGPEPPPSRPERIVQHIVVERGPSC
ncbi:MAG TPA: hypothetical protein VFY38_00740 [Pseudonocardia sp.]|nr:hypothetical protein [Pseudonocardia sp.]